MHVGQMKYGLRICLMDAEGLGEYPEEKAPKMRLLMELQVQYQYVSESMTAELHGKAWRSPSVGAEYDSDIHREQAITAVKTQGKERSQSIVGEPAYCCTQGFYNKSTAL